jgi:hypothetical protein
MPKITSRLDLNVGTEITIDEPGRTFTLVAAGNLIAKDGVTLQALYSKFVDLWATASYQDSPVPMYAIDALSGQFQFGTDGATFNGWRPANDVTRQMLRDGGWSEFSSAGVLNREYVGIVGLGAVSAGAQIYYQRVLGAASANFTFTDQVNEGIQVFGDASNGSFDSRTYFKGYLRESNFKFKDSTLADTAKTATGAYLVNLLLSNEVDLKTYAAGSPILDAAMSGAPYSGITVSYFTADQSRTIGGTPRNFKIIIAGNGATLEQIYTKIQFLLRQSTDINAAGTAGARTGNIQNALLNFVGDTLVTSQSVYIDNIQSADSNRIEFFDDLNVQRLNPFSSAGTISFNAPLVGAGSSFRLMFSAPPGAGNDFGEAGAVTVNDAAGTPITGTISTASVEFTYDYDGNVQGGFTAGTDRAVTLIGIRPGSGKYVAATGTLSRSKTIALSLVAEADRVYA